DAALHLAHRLAAGNAGNAAMRRPDLPARVLAYLVKGQACPFAKIELAQIVPHGDRQIETAADNPGGFLSALQGARVDRGDIGVGEALGSPGRLAAAAFR